MTSRILPPDEWDTKLAGTELDAVRHLLDPTFMQILVVEDGEQVVGCWSLMHVWHLEGLWIAPAQRKTASVGRRLWLGMRALMASVGAESAVTASMTDDVDQLLAGRALEIPGKWYLLKMEKD